MEGYIDEIILLFSVTFIFLGTYGGVKTLKSEHRWKRVGPVFLMLNGMVLSLVFLGFREPFYQNYVLLVFVFVNLMMSGFVLRGLIFTNNEKLR